MVAYTKEVEEAAQEKLGLAHDRMSAFRTEADMLSQVHVPAEIAETIVFDIFNARNAGKVLHLFNGAGMGADLPSRRETAWGLLNAATEFIDHHSGQRTSDQAKRLERAWFGVGQTEKNKVREAVIEYAQSV
jgi:hypothetical protein